MLGPQLQLERELQLGVGQLQLGELLQLQLRLLGEQLQLEQDAQPQLAFSGCFGFAFSKKPGFFNSSCLRFLQSFSV